MAGDKGVVRLPAALELLADEDEFERVGAVFELKMAALEGVGPDVDVLFRALGGATRTDPSPLVREVAALALAWVEDPRVGDVLWERTRQEEHGDVLASLVTGLTVIEDRRVVRLVAPFLEHESTMVRCSAVRAARDFEVWEVLERLEWMIANDLEQESPGLADSPGGLAVEAVWRIRNLAGAAGVWRIGGRLLVETGIRPGLDSRWMPDVPALVCSGELAYAPVGIFSEAISEVMLGEAIFAALEKSSRRLSARVLPPRSWQPEPDRSGDEQVVSLSKRGRFPYAGVVAAGGNPPEVEPVRLRMGHRTDSRFRELIRAAGPLRASKWEYSDRWRADDVGRLVRKALGLA